MLILILIKKNPDFNQKKIMMMDFYNKNRIFSQPWILIKIKLNFSLRFIYQSRLLRDHTFRHGFRAGPQWIFGTTLLKKYPNIEYDTPYYCAYSGSVGVWIFFRINLFIVDFNFEVGLNAKIIFVSFECLYQLNEVCIPS